MKKQDHLINLIVDYWMPVDQYIGGVELCNTSSLYSRFFSRALSKNNEEIKIKELFTCGLFTQGMVCHETYKNENNEWLSPDEVFFSKTVRNFMKLKIKKRCQSWSI